MSAPGPLLHNQADWVHFEVPLSLWHSLMQLYTPIQPSPNLHTQLSSRQSPSALTTEQIWRHPGWECKSCGFWSQVVAKQKLGRAGFGVWIMKAFLILTCTRVASSLILYLVMNSYPSGCVVWCHTSACVWTLVTLHRSVHADMQLASNVCCI